MASASYETASTTRAPANGANRADAFLTSFNFKLEVSLPGRSGQQPSAVAAFAEASGLEVSVDSVEVREGGFNTGVRRLIGKTSHPEIVLKRGLTTDAAFWNWVYRCTDGSFPLPYVTGKIFVHGPGGTTERAAMEPAIWRFDNGIVTKVRSADLNAGSASSVPLEEIHIAHEGLERVA